MSASHISKHSYFLFLDSQETQDTESAMLPLFSAKPNTF